MLFADDCLANIFSFLPLKDLLGVSLTSKQWFRVASSDFLWADHLQNTYMDTDWLQHTCRSRDVFILSRISAQDPYVVPSDVILDELSDFREHFVFRKTLLTKAPSTLFRSRNAFTSQLLLYALVYLLSMVCLILSLAVLCVLLPLYLDGIINITILNLNWTILPSVILVFIPFLLTISAIIINLLILRPRIVKHSQIFIQLGISFRGSTVDDSDTFQLAFISIYGWFFGIPVVLMGIYLRFWISAVYNPLHMSFQLSMLALYVFTVLYIIVTPILIIRQKCDQLLNRVLWIIYAVGASINFIGSVQVILVSAKLDQTISTYWCVVFLPVWIIAICALILCGIIPGIATYLWKMQLRGSRIDIMKYVMRSFTGIVTLFLPFAITLLLICLRADLLGDFFYTYAFFPMYTMWAALLGVMLGVMFYMCLTPLLDKLFV
jgi:hypothetical protein